MSPDGSDVRMVIASAGFDPRDFEGDGSVFYVKETDKGLFRLDLKSGQEKRVSWRVGYWNMDSLHVSGEWMYFTDTDGNRAPATRSAHGSSAPPRADRSRSNERAHGIAPPF